MNLISTIGGRAHLDRGTAANAVEAPALREEHQAVAAVDTPALPVNGRLLDVEVNGMLQGVVQPCFNAGVQLQREVVASRHKVERIDLEVEVTVACRDQRNVQSVKPGASVGHQRAEFRIHSEREDRALDRLV